MNRIPEHTATVSPSGREEAVDWDAPVWAGASALAIDNFHARSSDHRPQAQARVLHAGRQVFVLFDVHDRYVRCVTTEHNGPVCRDSCVEFFVQPSGGTGYFNFEVNCGGCLHVSYVEDPRRLPGAQGFAKYTPIPASQAASVAIRHSLPATIDPEITGPTSWRILLTIPLTLLEAYTGPLGQLGGQSWRANFYKCADDCSHPHWASWAPLGKALDFHQPQYFAPVFFAEST